MKNKIRDLAAMILIGSSCFMPSCKHMDDLSEKDDIKIEERSDMAPRQIFKYVKENKESQELMLQYIIALKEKESSPYSNDTIDAFYHITKREIISKKNSKNISRLKEMTSQVLLSDSSLEIFASLPKEERSRILKEYEAFESKSLIFDTGKKLQEYKPESWKKFDDYLTDKIYEAVDRLNVKDATDRVKRDASRLYNKAEETVNGK